MFSVNGLLSVLFCSVLSHFCKLTNTSLLGLGAEDGKSGFDSHSHTKPKRKEPIKVDINITVVPKSKKVSDSSCSHR